MSQQILQVNMHYSIPRADLETAWLGAAQPIADTPGLASINPAHRRATLQFLPSADAVLYLIDTQQPFTEGDASFLGIVRRHIDSIFIVQTKIDLWQQPQTDGRAAWEPAHDRIARLAAVHAHGTYVFALSARRYVEGVLGGDHHSLSVIDAGIAGRAKAIGKRALTDGAVIPSRPVAGYRRERIAMEGPIEHASGGIDSHSGRSHGAGQAA